MCVDVELWPDKSLRAQPLEHAVGVSRESEPHERSDRRGQAARQPVDRAVVEHRELSVGHQPEVARVRVGMQQPRARGAGDSVSSLHLKHLNPLPPGLENIFSGFNHILVVEMNDEGLYGFGQLGGLLRARYCDPKIRGITKTDGLTWKVKEILERAKTNVAAGLRKM